MHVKAIKKIQKGEQIFISYIDNSLSYETRKTQLIQYGFNCMCNKCKAKK